MQGADPRLIPGPPSPVPGPTTPRLLTLLLLAAALAFPLASRPLATWATNLPDPIPGAATWWDTRMAQAGLTTPYDIIHTRLRQWSGP